MRIRHLERGDTMVEVLIAIAVVSLILGGAYVTTNRSLMATRAAQERSIALKLAESQMERLKGLVATAPNTIFGAGASNPFCVSTANTIVSASLPDCTLGVSGAVAASGVQPAFVVSVQRVGNQFNLTESWVNVNGKITEKLQMRYRLYE